MASNIRLQNQRDLEFDLSRSLKFTCTFNGEVGLPIYEILSVSKSNYMSIPHSLGVIGS